MPKYRKYGNWEEEMMERALAAYHNGDMGLNAAARDYHIPKATLKRRIDGKNINAVEHFKAFGRTTDLPKEVERDLVNHVLMLEERFFGLTRNDLRRLAFEIAEANNIPHRFCKEKKMAGNKWYYKFLYRHPEISLRQPEATSIARVRGFCKERVMEFFNILGKVIDENQLDAIRIFNMDETALCTVQKPQKILALKGKHQVGAITSGERGTNTTCICCMSAAGMFVPPMLIFKRVRFKFELSAGSPPGSQFACTESGWITSEVFCQWLNHFIAITKPKKDKKILLVLDGHSTHTKNLEAIELCRENGIILISLPAHTTHKLQPLDVSFFKPLSVYFNQASDKWMRLHPMKAITQFQISELLGEAYGRAATVATAINGFAKTGIWPMDSNIFQDSDFMASSLQPLTVDADILENTNKMSEVLPSTSMTLSPEKDQCDPLEETSMMSPKCQNYKKVVEISPLPKLSNDKRTKKGTTSVTVLTSSPYKTVLKEKKERESLKKVVMVLKDQTLKQKNKEAQKAKKNMLKRKKGKSKNDAVKEIKNQSENTWYCKLCTETVVRDMIQCMQCRGWVHEDCAKVGPRKKCYNCEECK